MLELNSQMIESGMNSSVSSQEEYDIFIDLKSAITQLYNDTIEVDYNEQNEETDLDLVLDFGGYHVHDPDLIRQNKLLQIFGHKKEQEPEINNELQELIESFSTMEYTSYLLNRNDKIIYGIKMFDNGEYILEKLIDRSGVNEN